MSQSDSSASDPSVQGLELRFVLVNPSAQPSDPHEHSAQLVNLNAQGAVIRAHLPSPDWTTRLLHGHDFLALTLQRSGAPNDRLHAIASVPWVHRLTEPEAYAQATKSQPLYELGLQFQRLSHKDARLLTKFLHGPGVQPGHRHKQSGEHRFLDTL